MPENNLWTRQVKTENALTNSNLFCKSWPANLGGIETRSEVCAHTQCYGLYYVQPFIYRQSPVKHQPIKPQNRKIKAIDAMSSGED